mmetsp:Transcript_27397/g.45838  ORF Transcript_27397/g.45838 Transcript_27397/m.45838 type:complete len:186 (-) Transcript_27397:221-778(-)
MGFGTGIVPEGCGFSLQNRGHNFSLDPQHPNCLAPSKRPFHTIIPALCTYPGRSSLALCLGVMGGFMQPQGHLQVLSNLLDLKMDPQAALDAPRFCVDHGGGSVDVSRHSELNASDMATSKIYMEAHFSAEAAEEMEERGHEVMWPVGGHERAKFGRGQIITRDPLTGVLCGGSDPRADGQALAW